MAQNDETPAKAPPLPGHETQSDEMACPKCGRFVGAATKCPYCGARVEKRMSLVAIRWAAILLSTVGLVLLYLMARTREPELIRIGDIEATMNFGAVRLVGEVRNDPRPFKSGNGMSFNVNDGTGTIIVFVDQAQRKAMVDEGLVPRKGDGIDFVAQLQASSSGNSARIRSLAPASFKLMREGVAPVARADDADGGASAASAARAPAPSALPAFGPVVAFSAVDESFVGKSVLLEGTVVSIAEPDPGSKKPYVLTLGDGADTREVKLWPDQYGQIPDPQSLPGTAVRVKVAVKLFQDKVDLVLRSGSDLWRAVPAAGEPAPVVALAAVDESYVGKSVTLEGAVAAIKEPDAGTKRPYVLTLTNATDSVEIKFWPDQYQQIADPASLPGAAVRVKAAVKLFQGKVDLQLKSGADLRRAGSAAAKPVVRRPPVPVAQITAATVNSYATVEGALSDPSDLEGKGMSYKLTDDSGSILAVFWNGTIPADLQRKAAAAARVRVNGKVKDYQGTLEIVPGATGLEILE